MPVMTTHIDGSQGEGGGQILRTSVGLAAALGTPVHLTGIRAGRQRPGLRPQHLAAVRAAAAVCGAETVGAEIGSMELTFTPGAPRAGKYRFDIGTAGSTTLVLHTVLPALMVADGESDVTVTGGTHNPLAPSFEHFRDVFLPLATVANLHACAALERAGFYPSGGGEVRFQVLGITSPDHAEPLRFTERGELKRIEGLSAASYCLPPHIIERQANQMDKRLRKAGHRPTLEKATWETFSPGTTVFLRAVFCRTVAGWFALGARGKPAERVADEAVDDLLAFLDTPGVVDAHTADQLLVLTALSSRESRYVAERVTDHLQTNANVLTQLTRRPVDILPGEGESATVVVHAQ